MSDTQSTPTGEAADRLVVASTVSPEAAQALTSIYGIMSQMPARTRPQSAEDWDADYASMEGIVAPLAASRAKAWGVAVSAEQLGGVGVLRLTPPDHRPSGRTLVYVHGGAYVALSAASTLTVAALVAVAMGDEVISIDYTVAPRGTWQSCTDQVLAVWKALLDADVRPESGGLFGDSAGGGMAAGAVLKMRDRGLPLPAALYLLSPWSDITATGDSYTTLTASDPILKADSLSWAADAYVDTADQKHPYVSPVYGDYAKPFPPTLIQVGTREIFLSHAVRHYQAIRAAGREAILDVYEGMPHVYQALIPDAPETAIAIARAVEFFTAHLSAG